MYKALFQHIPRCLFEPVAFLGLIGLILFLRRHWKKDKAETLLFGGTVLFMVVWRLMMPINADRYTLILIPPAIFFSIDAIREIAEFCRKYIPKFPDYRIFLGVLMIGCIGKSFSGNREDKLMFGMVDFLKQEAKDSPGKVKVVSNRDLSLFLGDRFEFEYAHIDKNIRLSKLPRADYYLLKLNFKKQTPDPADRDFQQIKKIRKNGGKFDFILWKRNTVR